VKILDLPFRERPVLELLGFDDERIEVDRDYAGYGWARVPTVWLVDGDGERRVDDALVLALHSDDNAHPLADDVELMFELPDGEPVTVLASMFLEKWLPTLPAASAIVLAMCNPHHAALRVPGTNMPVDVATGDVEAWIDDDKGGRLELCAAGSWARLTS
jgi:hypothetical protein